MSFFRRRRTDDNEGICAVGASSPHYLSDESYKRRAKSGREFGDTGRTRRGESEGSGLGLRSARRRWAETYGAGMEGGACGGALLYRRRMPHLEPLRAGDQSHRRRLRDAWRRLLRRAIRPGCRGCRHARDYGFDFPVLLDPAQTLANQTGVTLTPTAVILSPAGELLYRGRIDNRYLDFGKYRDAGVKPDLRLALDAVIAGKPVAEKYTKSIGCALPPPGGQSTRRQAQ